MTRENYIPESPKGKALAYLRRELPRGFHGAAQKTIRDAMGTNGTPTRFNYQDGVVEISKVPGKWDVIYFSDLIPAVERYFDEMKRNT